MVIIVFKLLTPNFWSYVYVCVWGGGLWLQKFWLMLKLIFAVHYLKYLYFICIYLYYYYFCLNSYFLFPLTLSPFLSQLFDMRIRLKAQRVDIDGCQVVFKAHSFFTSCLDWTMNCTGEKNYVSLRNVCSKLTTMLASMLWWLTSHCYAGLLLGCFWWFLGLFLTGLSQLSGLCDIHVSQYGSSPVYLIVCQAKRAQHTQ